jgi:1-deoxy-D-xylulose-5-phosphate synthase
VVILNDNTMSISPNVGGLSKYLSRLSMKARYQSFRRKFDSWVKKIPGIGEGVYDGIIRLKRAVKAIFYTDNFFVDLGFEYVGPIEGHHIQQLEQVLKDVRNLDHPVVVHVITRKGKGYELAEEDPGTYHGVSSFSLDRGLPAYPKDTSFTDVFSRLILEAGRRDPRIVTITAAMEKGTGLSAFKGEFPHRFFDVGITEEHAITFAAGLAVQGLRPVVAIYSTFIQRAVDQVIHDTALQKLPITFVLDRSGFVGDDGETHQGLFDIALFRPIPHMTILAPMGEAEFRLMLTWSLTGTGPSVIRYPKGPCPREDEGFTAPLEWGRGLFLRQRNASLCLAFTGGLYTQVLDAARLLETRGIPADLYNLRFLKPIDEAYLTGILNRYDLVIFIEEGVLLGGFGEYAAALGKQKHCAARIMTLGGRDRFMSQGTREELLQRNGLNGEEIALFAAGEYVKEKGVFFAQAAVP